MGQNFSIEMIKPKDLKDAKLITDKLLDDVPIIVNLEETDKTKTKQIIDYIRGTAISSGCHMEQIGQEIFIFTPQNINLEVIE
jgi:FtsZ-interacting cell division protein YlmF